MNAGLRVAALVLFVVGCLILLAVIVGARDHNVAILTLKLQQLFQGAGMLIALIAAVVLLFRAAGGEGILTMVPCAAAVFAGLCVAQPGWPSVSGLAVMGIAAIAASVFERRQN